MSSFIDQCLLPIVNQPMTAGLIKGGEVNIKKSRNRLTEMEDNISNQYRSQN